MPAFCGLFGSVQFSTENRKCLPSGRKKGQRCAGPILGPLLRVTCSGMPPLDGTRYKGPATLGAKRMASSLFHVPPKPSGDSQTTWTPPPLMSIVFSLESEKKPIWRLSGAQKGYAAPAVSVSCCALAEAKSRSHRLVCPSAVTATNARRVPSGEIVKL